MKKLVNFILESESYNNVLTIDDRLRFKNWAVRNGLAGKKWYFDGEECVDGVSNQTVIVNGQGIDTDSNITWGEALQLLKQWFLEHPQPVKSVTEKQKWDDAEIDAITRFFERWSDKFSVEVNTKTGTLNVYYEDKPNEYFILYRRKFTIRLNVGQPMLRLIKQHTGDDATLDDMFETLVKYISKRYNISQPI